MGRFFDPTPFIAIKMKTEIRSGKQKAAIELFEDRAPRAAQKISRLLPITVPLCHAKFAGDELMFMIPAVIEPEFLKTSIEPGDVLYYPIQQTVCLFFGEHIVPFGQGPFNAIGRIVEGASDLAQLAELIVHEGFQLAQFKQNEASKGKTDEAFSDLAAEIAGQREKIWQEAPPELERLKSHQTGRAGNFAVRVYAFADAYRSQRNLWLFRKALKDQTLDVASAHALLAVFLLEIADRFDIWALYTLARLFRKVASHLPEVATADELVNLLDALLIYNNRWWLWLDGCIPWFEPDSGLLRGF
jgi:hypothetical protein